MTDKQIMQALNCCTSKSISCQKCPLLRKSKCERELIRHSFDLINRQQEELDRLERHTKMHDEIQAEAIRDFEDKLGEHIEYHINENGDFVPYVKLSDIEKVVYEMVGAENE